LERRLEKRSAFRQTFFKQTFYFPIVLYGDICNLVTPDGAVAYQAYVAYGF